MVDYDIYAFGMKRLSIRRYLDVAFHKTLKHIKNRG